MGIAELLTLVPTLIQYGPPAIEAGKTVVQYIQNLIADNRPQTTAEETAALQAALAELAKANDAFDKAFAGVPVSQ